jgi:hypothetical protein
MSVDNFKGYIKGSFGLHTVMVYHLPELSRKAEEVAFGVHHIVEIDFARVFCGFQETMAGIRSKMNGVLSGV